MDRVLVVLIPAVDKGTHNWGPDPDGPGMAARQIVRGVANLSWSAMAPSSAKAASALPVGAMGSAD
jgi:hypothetical protein